MATYEIWFTNDRGARLAQLNRKALLDDALSFECTKTVNDLGALHITLPESFDRNLLKRDNMIQIWRAPPGGRLSMFQAYFINRYRFSLVGGQKVVEAWGAGPNDLLARRVVAYYNGSTTTIITGYEADDAMKSLVSDNIISVTAFDTGEDSTERQWSTVTNQADLTAGPQVDMTTAWCNLLRILQDLSAASQSAGNQVWFEMVPVLATSSISFQFRTYTGQPGQDLTDIGVSFSADKGTLRDVRLEYDYSGEKNYIYGLGQGEDSDRDVAPVSDDDRINASFYGRREGTVNATIETDTNATEGVAYSALYDGRPRVRFEASTVDTAQFRFGRDWNVGDKLRARFENKEFDCIAKTAQIVMRNQQETITARLEYES